QAEGPRGDLITAERALNASIEVRRKLAQATPDDANRQRALLSATRMLAETRRHRGNATQSLDENLLEELNRRWPKDAAAAGEVALVWREVALDRSQREEREPALAAIRRATQIAQEAVELLPTDPSLRRILALCHATHSDLLNRTGHYDAAVPEIDRALAIA